MKYDDIRKFGFRFRLSLFPALTRMANPKNANVRIYFSI